MTADSQLRASLKYISADTQECRQREYSRCGGRGDQQGADNGDLCQDMGHQHRIRVMIRREEYPVERQHRIGMLGQRRGTNRWADDPVRIRGRGC